MHTQEHIRTPSSLDMTDAVLAKQVLNGDQEAFELLVRRYNAPLFNFICRFLGDYDQACDISQQVFLQLYLSLPTLRTGDPLKAWLFQVARNRCLDELRKRRRRAEVPFSTLEREDGEEGLSPLEAILDPDPLPEEMTERGELHGSLHAAIVSLPPKFRSIVYLHCFRQLTFAEIGRTLNMPETTVKNYFYRSLPRLRRALASSVHFASVS